MVAQDRLRTRGARRAKKLIDDFAAEVLGARVGGGLSQDEVGRRLGWSGDKVARIEGGRSPSLTIGDASQLAAILGLDLAVRAYPNGTPVRDAAQAKRLAALISHVGPLLRCRADAPLPQRADRPAELRAWDVLIIGRGERTGAEYESRLADFQAVIRRHNLKRRDDPVDHFLLVVADTRHNRRVLDDLADVAADLPRLATADVLAALESGRHPGTGVILF